MFGRKPTVADPTPYRFQFLQGMLAKFRPIKDSRRIDGNAMQVQQVKAGQGAAGYPTEVYPDLPEAMVPAANWLDFAHGPSVQPGTGAGWDAFGPAGPDMMPGRVPRLMYPNLDMLAGLRSMNGAQVTADYLFLPPLAVQERGTTRRAVSGGRNRVSGSMSAGMAHIPATYVPLGHRGS